jgi:hypothetical protein
VQSFKPDKPTCCGLPLALSKTERKPLPFFSDQWTLMLQGFPAPKLVPQLFASENGPVTVNLLMLRVAVPELLKVAVRWVMHWHPALITFLHSNTMLVGDNVAFAPELTAVPLGVSD